MRLRAFLITLALLVSLPLVMAQRPAGTGPPARTGAPVPDKPSMAPDAGGVHLEADRHNTPLKFSSRTQIVLVPVIVQDKDRRHVSGLKKEDFQVFENGKEQSIASVEEIVSDTKNPVPVSMSANTASNVYADAGRQKRLTIIAFDMVNTSFEDQAHARRSLGEYLSRLTDSDNALYELVLITHKNIRVLQDFTADRSRLAALVKALVPETHGDRVTDVSRSDTITVSAVTSQGQDFGAFLAGAEKGDLEAYMRTLFTEDVSYQQAEAVNATLSAFHGIAESVSGIPGRKSLIWVTAGFPFQLEDNNIYLTAGQPNGAYESAMQALNDANISLYPVDARGLKVIGLPDATFSGSRVSVYNPQGQVAAAYRNQGNTIALMDQFAQMTGGKAYYNRNDIDNSIREADNDSASYYMLSYPLNKKDTRSGWRKLNVKVKGEKLQVRSRKGFFLNEYNIDPALTRKQDITQAMRSPLNYTALPAFVKWLQVTNTGEKRAVKFMIQVPPRAATVDESDENHLSVDFLAIASDKKGDQADMVSQTLESKLKPDGVQLVHDKGINYTNQLEVEPGEYTVHFIVRDNLNGRTGSVVVTLKVT